MTEDEAVAALDALPGYDNESEHDQADGILLAFTSPAVADAWRRAQARVGFWYA